MMTRSALALALGLGLLAPLGCDDDSGGDDTDTAASTGSTTSTPTTDPSTSTSATSDPTTVGTTDPQTSTTSGSSGEESTASTTGSSGDGSSSEGSSSTGSAVAVATASIVAKSGSEAAGEANFYDEGGQFRVEITVNNAGPQGLHGVHIHETGDCSAEDGTSAGNHWNPGGAQHGPFETGHLGDLGNIEIDENGDGTMTLTTTMSQWAVGSADDSDLLARAIILHEREDDLSPSPNPGPRIGCGEIVAP